MKISQQKDTSDRLSNIVQWIYEISEQAEEPLPRPAQGTYLREVDDIIPMHSIRDAIGQNRAVIVEHLYTIAHCLREGQLFPPFSLITLNRGCLESLGQGMWLMATSRPSEMITRILTLRNHNVKMRSKLDTKEKFDDQVHSSRILEIAASAGLANKELTRVTRGLVKSTEMLKTGSSYFGMAYLLEYWKIASGVAHGLPWGLMGTTRMEEVEGSRGQHGASFRMTGNTETLEDMLFASLWGLLSLNNTYARHAQGDKTTAQQIAFQALLSIQNAAPPEWLNTRAVP